MKRFYLFSGLVLITLYLSAQTRIDSLIQQGVYYHDAGEYNKAIELYNQALKIDPNSDAANYELAMTYMYAKEYENSIKYSDIVIELNKKNVLQAYTTKGSSLDYLGKTNESIKTFEKALRKFGAHYLLYYNLGYDYYKMKNYDKATEAFTNAIRLKSSHASSHLLLGYVMADQKKDVQSLLCLHYFLFLEPNTERSKTAFQLLKKQFGGNVRPDKEKPDQINIVLSTDQMDSEFGPASMMISMLEASGVTEREKGKTEDQLFMENTKSFFNLLGELKKEKNKGLWWDFYVPFFNDIANSDQIETYCYYISQSSVDTAKIWLNNNNPKLVLFDLWLKNKPQ
jgi:tetratricopeptide (TPR) repeat protein